MNQPSALPAATDRFRFREYRPSDLDAVFEMFGDPVARQFYPQMSELDNCRRWIEWNLENYNTRGVGLWVLEDVVSGEFLGDCGLTYQPVEENQLLEVGYHLLASYRGRGLVTESSRKVVDFGFDRLDVPLICSIVHPDNQASIAVARRIHDFE